MINSYSLQFQKIKDDEKKFITRHPILAPIATSVVSAGVGVGLGSVLPISEDSFVQHALIQKADEYLKEIHDSIGVDNAKASRKLAELRKVVGNDAFKKLVKTDFRGDEIASLGSSLVDLEVEQSKKIFENSLVEDFKKFKNKDAEILKKYEELPGMIQHTNMKNLATILGVSTLLITGVYSYFRYLASKKKSQ